MTSILLVNFCKALLEKWHHSVDSVKPMQMILHQYKHETAVRGNMLQCLWAWKRLRVCSSTCPLPNRLDIDYHRINAPGRPTIVTQNVVGIYVQYANNTQNINTMNIVSSSLYEFKISDSVGDGIAEAHSPLKRQ